MDATVIATVAASVFTITVSYFVSRNKGKTDSFKALIEANESFREEIRKDLAESKRDLDIATKAMTEMRIQIEGLQTDLYIAKSEISRLGSQCRKYEVEKVTDQAEIANLRVEVDRLEKELKGYRNTGGLK